MHVSCVACRASNLSHVPRSLCTKICGGSQQTPAAEICFRPRVSEGEGKWDTPKAAFERLVLPLPATLCGTGDPVFEGMERPFPNGGFPSLHQPKDTTLQHTHTANGLVSCSTEGCLLSLDFPVGTFGLYRPRYTPVGVTLNVCFLPG